MQPENRLRAIARRSERDQSASHAPTVCGQDVVEAAGFGGAHHFKTDSLVPQGGPHKGWRRGDSDAGSKQDELDGRAVRCNHFGEVLRS
jgi:hypothetical protein